MVITMNADRDVFVDGYVAITDGQVAAVGTSSECEYSGTEELGGDGYIVIPGLVNVHAHLVQGSMRGMADATTF